MGGQEPNGGRSLWWRFMLGSGGAAAVLLGVFALRLGGCHGGGGFCAGEFSDDLAGALAMGAVGLVGGAVGVVRAVSRRPWPQWVAAAAAAAVATWMVARALP